MTNCEKFERVMSELIADAMDKKLYTYPYGKSEIPMVVKLFIAMLKNNRQTRLTLEQWNR